MKNKKHPFKRNILTFLLKDICWKRCLLFLAKNIIIPKSRTEDSKRIEFIVNIIIIGSISLMFFLIITTYNEQKNLGANYHGISLYPLFGILFFFCFLLFLSRIGYFIISGYTFIIIYYLATTYTIYHWGANVPEALLGYALMIIMVSILIGTRASIVATILIVITELTIGNLQISAHIIPRLYWKEQDMERGDLIEYSVTLGIITLISWLSNREIEKSLIRARKSEAELKVERDSLEEKVKARTAELRQTQYDKLRQLYRFAEFGRLSSGLFHDFNNYMMALSLNLEKLKTHQGADLEKVRNYITQAFDVSNKMENFTEAIQNQLKKQETKKTFSLNKEMSQVLQLFNYRSKKEQIELNFLPKEEIYTFGNNIKFSQAMTNVLSNAFDSYFELSLERKREVLVKIDVEDDSAVITVEDGGCGIPKKNIQKIFDPFFTTKDPTHGTGIGLASTKEIIEKNFEGTIQVESQLGKGSKFTIIIPIKIND